jgi:hypothetical protein
MLMRSRRFFFDLLLCLSLLNLLLLRVWAQLLPEVVHPANLYYIEQAPKGIHYLTVVGILFGASLVACVAVARARRSARRWPLGAVRTAVVVVFLLAINSLAHQFLPDLPARVEGMLGTAGTIALGAALLGGCLWLARVRSGLLFGVIEGFGVLAAPFVVMTVGQAGWTWTHLAHGSFAGQSLASPVLAPTSESRPEVSPRVVFILFDELDQRVAFSGRPKGLDLPALDHLREVSLAASNAYPPAGETRQSISSLLLGAQVTWSRPTGPSALACAIGGGGEANARRDCWVEMENLFERLRGDGVVSAVSGWYHPYCRIFHASLASCTWAGLPYWDSPHLVDSLDQLWTEVVKPIPAARLWLRPGTRIRRAHRDAFERIQAAAIEIVRDPRFDFAFLHLPVPHHPDIYDPVARTLSIRDERSYLDNVELADRALAELRRAMEEAALWNKTTVIVSSDHWWRAIHRGDWGLTAAEEALFGDGPDRRVPVLVKLAGQQSPISYAKTFNTIVLHDLVLEIFAGRIRTAPELATWLDARRSETPIRYTGWALDVEAAGALPGH